jgi:PAS domain S-box-containing protein
MAKDILDKENIEKIKINLSSFIEELEFATFNGSYIDIYDKEFLNFDLEIKRIIQLINKLISFDKRNEDIVYSLENEILKRKLAEELLKNERDFISTIFNNTSLLVIIIDQLGNIISLNNSCEGLTGYKTSEIKGKNFWNLFIKEYTKKEKEILLEDLSIVYNKSSLVNYWKKKDGKRIIVSWSITAVLNEKSEIKAYAVTGLDVTKIEFNKVKLKRQAKILRKKNLELTKNQKIIKEEKNKAQEYLNIASVIILALDLECKITMINKSGCEILNLTRKELINKDWIETAIPFRKKEEYKKFYNTLIEDKDTGTKYHESEIINKNGEEKIIAWRYLLLFDEKNNVIGVLASGNDITKQKEIDLMKSELINTVSHEIRTPLGSIMGFTELMIKRKLSEEKSKSYLNTIYKESIRLMNLINDFLDIQRIENGNMLFNMEKFRINSLIDNVNGIFENNKTHKLVIDEFENIEIFADYNKILQVLTNFISNAIKYSPEAQVVNLKIETINEVINFAVKDYGFGIKKEYIDKIFSKFYRIDHGKNFKIQGTGLGLAICKEIISAHGGIIWVESEIGKGSTFYFSIPLVRS